MIKKIHKKKGMSIIMVIIIIGTAGLLMAEGAAFLSLGELDMGQTVSAEAKSFYNAQTCMEEALLRLKRDNNFSAVSKIMNLEYGICSMDVMVDGSNRIIETTGIFNDYRKTLKATGVISAEGVNLTAYSESF